MASKATVHYPFTDFGAVDDGLRGKLSMTITTVRHGETVANRKLMAGEAGAGATSNVDEVLTPEGETQVEETIAALQNFGGDFHIVMCSPLTRAVRTAAPIWHALCAKAEAAGKPTPTVVVDADLREFWKKDSVSVAPPSIEPFATAFGKTTDWVCGKETLKEFHARVQAFTERITVEYEHMNVLIVGHSMFLNSFCGGANAFLATGRESAVYHHPNCSITSIGVTHDSAAATVLNYFQVGYTAHLSAPTGHHSPLNTLHLV